MIRGRPWLGHDATPGSCYHDGVATTLFSERTSLPLLLIRRELEQAQQRGLLLHDMQRIAPSQLGQRFLNDLLQIFLTDKN